MAIVFLVSGFLSKPWMYEKSKHLIWLCDIQTLYLHLLSLVQKIDNMVMNAYDTWTDLFIFSFFQEDYLTEGQNEK